MKWSLHVLYGVVTSPRGYKESGTVLMTVCQSYKGKRRRLNIAVRSCVRVERKKDTSIERKAEVGTPQRKEVCVMMGMCDGRGAGHCSCLHFDTQLIHGLLRQPNGHFACVSCCQKP